MVPPEAVGQAAAVIAAAVPVADQAVAVGGEEVLWKRREHVLYNKNVQHGIPLVVYKALKPERASKQRVIAAVLNLTKIVSVPASHNGNVPSGFRKNVR